MLFSSISAHFSVSQLVCDRPTDRPTDRRTDGPPDGPTDGRTHSLIGKNRIEDSRFFQYPEETSFSIFSTGHFGKVDIIYGPNGTTNETYRAKTLASPGHSQKVSMIYLLRFRRYMRPNK